LGEQETKRKNPEGECLKMHQRLLENKLLICVMLEGKNAEWRTECFGFFWLQGGCITEMHQ
jgi:hypothetical protein